MEDIQEAITVARQAVQLTPDDSPSLEDCLNNLKNKLQTLKCGSPTALAAIHTVLQMEAGTPKA